MNKKVATLILNRNLPVETEKLVEQLKSSEDAITDIFVIESGSDEKLLSKYSTWWANDPTTMAQGLRYPRGFNFGLSQLVKENRYKNYDYYLLLVNDVEIERGPFIGPLVEIMEAQSRLGILSPCSKEWGEKSLLQDSSVKYFWTLSQVAWLIRREMIDDLANFKTQDFHQFFYDGSNFRGYQADLEIVMKGYLNSWASGITSKVWATENKTHLVKKSDLIKTDPYEESLKLCVQEGREWLHRKYGYSSRWQMPLICKNLYEQFFAQHPQLEKFRI